MKNNLLVLLMICVVVFYASSQQKTSKSSHGLGDQTLTLPIGGSSKRQVQVSQTMGTGNRHIINPKIKGSDNVNNHKTLDKANDAGANILDGNGLSSSKLIKSKIKTSKDSVFYLNVTKRYGWPEGVGVPLKKEELSHIPVYYVLSNKNSNGKWTFMRAYDSYGNLTTNHSWGAYILNQNDESDLGANADWVNKLKTVCQWEYIGDSEGKEVIQERALDRDKNIVFCYNIVKITENKKDGSSIYSGSYTDAFALPIFMRVDSTGNYKGQANFVQVKRDNRGYETRFAFTDETGHIRLNKDGAYQTSKVYDDKGGQIREASLDLAGNQMIDSYGNCGWNNITDDYGNPIKAIYFGKDNEPIKMSGTRGADQVYGYEIEYDKYHRLKDKWYLDSLGNRDINEFGVYHTVCEYNDHGERTLLSHLDREGNLIGSDTYGIAQFLTEYDNNGNLKLVEWRDKNASPVNGYGDYCRQIRTYDVNGKSLSQREYTKNENDSIIESFEYLRDNIGNEIRRWYLDGYFKIDSVDMQGRVTLEAWYDLDNNPIARPTDEQEAWHKHVITYDDDNSIEKEEWFDKDGEYYVNTDYSVSNKFNVSINQKNIDNNILTSTQCLKPYGLIQKFQKQFDEEGNIIAQWDITPYGEHARVGWWNNLHYKCNVNYTMYGTMMDMIGVNEFDEPSYLVSLNDNGEVYHYNDMETYFDENMQVIPSNSMASFKESLPKAFCIEVTDTAIAYPLGLKNGDIILSFGDWSTSKDLRSNLNNFYLETILQNNKTKKISVLRHDVKNQTSNIFEYELPDGKPSELGFYAHQIYYTQKEAARLHEACIRYDFKYGRSVETSDKEILMGVQLKGGLIQTRFYHFPLYNYKDPGFLLYASEKYSSGQDAWSVLYDDISTWEKNRMFDSSFSGDTELFLTQDMLSFKKLTKNSKGNRGLRIIPIKVSDEVYNDLITFYKTIDELPTHELVHEIKHKKTFKNKQLLGKWKAEFEDKEGSASLTLNIEKNNHIQKKVVFCFEGEIGSEITLKLNATISDSGRWILQGDKLCLKIDNDTRQVQLDGYDLIGANEIQQKAFMEKIEGHESELLELLISTADEILSLSSIEIDSVSKKELSVRIGEDVILFKKI